MCSEIRIYFEGDKALRPGFREFLRELADLARANRCSFHVVAAGSGPEAVKDFKSALSRHHTAKVFLLKDSEGPVREDWQASFLRENELNPAHADSIFWMVEMMEAWFHADPDSLARFYGNGFRKGALRANPNVERIPKRDLESGLSAATRDSQKGDYFKHKTAHGPALLGAVDPSLVCEKAPHCGRLFNAVRAALS